MAAWKAAALQEPPPKCLMILIDLPEGDRGSNVQRIQYPHIDAVARDGRAGHLALRAVSGSHGTKDLSVFAQLLGISKVRIQGCRHFNLFLHRWFVPLQQFFCHPCRNVPENPLVVCRQSRHVLRCLRGAFSPLQFADYRT
jgi:hypothetical protein